MFRKNYLEKYYNRKIQKIRDNIGKNYYYIIMFGFL